MADNGLKPIWGSQPVPTPDLGGDLATSRGTDPNIDTGGSSGLTASPWASGGKQSPITTDSGAEETGNSVSGLPSLPNRYAPAPGQPPMPPTLTERNPGTIDQK